MSRVLRRARRPSHIQGVPTSTCSSHAQVELPLCDHADEDFSLQLYQLQVSRQLLVHAVAPANPTRVLMRCPTDRERAVRDAQRPHVLGIHGQARVYVVGQGREGAGGGRERQGPDGEGRRNGRGDGSMTSRDAACELSFASLLRSPNLYTLHRRVASPLQAVVGRRAGQVSSWSLPHCQHRSPLPCAMLVLLSRAEVNMNHAHLICLLDPTPTCSDGRSFSLCRCAAPYAGGPGAAGGSGPLVHRRSARSGCFLRAAQADPRRTTSLHGTLRFAGQGATSRVSSRAIPIASMRN